MGGGFDPFGQPSFNSFQAPGRSDYGMGGRSESRGSSRGGSSRGAPFVEPVQPKYDTAPAPYVDPFAADPYADPFGPGPGPVPGPVPDPYMDPYGAPPME